MTLNSAKIKVDIHQVEMDQKTNMIRLADFPQLRLITWNRCDDGMVDEREALAIYERNWRFVDQARLDENEKALIERLVQDLGGGRMNVYPASSSADCKTASCLQSPITPGGTLFLRRRDGYCPFTGRISCIIGYCFSIFFQRRLSLIA